MKQYVGILEKQVAGEAGGLGSLTKGNGRKAGRALSNVCAVGAKPPLARPIHRRGVVEKIKVPAVKPPKHWLLKRVPYLRGGVRASITPHGSVLVEMNSDFWRRLWRLAAKNKTSNPMEFLIRREIERTA